MKRNVGEALGIDEVSTQSHFVTQIAGARRQVNSSLVSYSSSAAERFDRWSIRPQIKEKYSGRQFMICLIEKIV